MKILHLIPSIDLSAGGPSQAVIEMCTWQKKLGIQSEIATTHFSSSQRRIRGLKIHSFLGFGQYKFSPGLYWWLSKNIQNYDLVHIHSLFCFSTFIGSRLANRHKIPYIIRPLGQLMNWAVHHGRTKVKQLYYRLIERETLCRAVKIHFTTEIEAKDIFFKDLRIQDYILPLGVDFPPLKIKGVSIYPGKKYLLSLSRLVPNKGVANIIKAFAVLPQNYDWLLVIAGGGEKSYVNFLKNLATDFGLKNKVIFTGQVHSKRKDLLLRYAQGFISASESESFGLSLVEAMAYGLTILAPKNIGLADILKKNPGNLIFENKMLAIREAMVNLIKSNSSLAGRENRKIAKNLFNWKNITKEQIKTYQKIICIF